MVNPAKWPSTKIICAIGAPLLFDVHTHDLPLPVATDSFRRLSNRWSLPKRAGRLLQGEPSAFKSRKDPYNGVPCKEPSSRPQSGCHLGRHEAGPYSLTGLPWHHARPLTHIPKPLSEDSAQKSPPELTS